jgi:hypothetical protein
MAIKCLRPHRRPLNNSYREVNQLEWQGATKRVNKPKGGLYVVDNRFDTDNSVGAGTGEQLHNGRVDSRPSGNCNHSGAAQRYSGTQRVT